MNLLHLDSSILGGNSVSRQLSAAAVGKLRTEHPSIDVVYRDLAASPIAHLSGAYLAGQNSDVQHDQAMQEDLALGGEVLAEFLAADIVVIGVGFYNFSVPSQLKAWIDRILVVGKTFRYTATGPEGLAAGKKVVLTIARGGVYKAGAPHAAFEHAESYLRACFGFIGITDPQVIVAEGVALGPKPREASVEAALDEVARLAA